VKLFTLVVASSLPDYHGIGELCPSRWGYVRPRLRASIISYVCRTPAVPLGVALGLVQASIYDVPGGYRAVMFDRFSGVKNTARHSLTSLYSGLIPTNVGDWRGNPPFGSLVAARHPV
jgi:hypothetical protein